MSEKQLALAAALAGVATVDLGGAGAGRYLQTGIGDGTTRDSMDDAAPRAAGASDDASDDVWRRILFRPPAVFPDQE